MPGRLCFPPRALLPDPALRWVSGGFIGFGWRDSPVAFELWSAHQNTPFAPTLERWCGGNLNTDSIR
jgi:hypothetical protein